jgi:hypothetical protein
MPSAGADLSAPGRNRVDSHGSRATSRAPRIVLALVLLASVAVLYDLSRGLTFYQDTWAFLMHRQEFTAAAFLEPHNEHIVVIPVAIEKALVALFGMTSATPEYVVLIAMLTVTAGLVYLYVGRRLGAWPAVMGTSVVLFLGPAWTVLLWPFQIGFVGAMMTGLAMLLMLEREDRRGDRIACALLAVCLAFSSLGLSFACAAAADVAVQRSRRGLRRIYLLAVPFALFAVWYLGWGHDAESHISLHNVLVSPRYLLEGLAASSQFILGLNTLPVEGGGRPVWGAVVLVALVLFAVAWKIRRPEFDRRLWPSAAALFSYWLLAASNYIPGREAVANRYAYTGVVLLLLVLADFFRDLRISRPALVVAALVTAAAVTSNLVRLNEGRDFLEEQTILTRADLGALDIAQDTVSPTFSLTPEIAATPSLIDVNAAEYLPAMRDHGSPGYSVAELASASPETRHQADVVLANALPISIGPYRGRFKQPRNSRCVVVRPSGSGEVPVTSEGTLIEADPGPTAELALRRFGDRRLPVQIGGLPGDSAVELTVPADRSSRRWHLEVQASQSVRVCAGG